MKIRWALGILLVAFAAFLFRELRNKTPLINVRALMDRNLAMGSFLIFILGGGIYGITTILPLFFQTLMAYDATHAGLSVSPRGLGSIVAAITVGLVSAKVDPRKLVALGFAIFSGPVYGPRISRWISPLIRSPGPSPLAAPP